MLEPRPVDLYQVLSTTLRVCRDQAGPMLLACSLAILPFTAVDILCALAAVEPPSVLNFASAIANAWLYATLGRLALPAIDGQPITFGQASAAASPLIGATFWVSLLQGLGVFFGLLLFVVPGVWLWIVCYVAVPVVLFEDLRGIAALRRSIELTRAARFPIFVLGLLTTLLLGLAVGAIVVPGVLAVLATPTLDATPVLGGLDYGLLFIGAGLQYVWSMLGTVAMTAVYAQVRERNTSEQVRAIAEVFS